MTRREVGVIGVGATAAAYVCVADIALGFDLRFHEGTAEGEVVVIKGLLHMSGIILLYNTLDLKKKHIC